MRLRSRSDRQEAPASSEAMEGNGPRALRLLLRIVGYARRAPYANLAGSNYVPKHVHNWYANSRPRDTSAETEVAHESPA